MAASLRGQLGVKSSPLCPTSSKLTTQYLVLDHMTHHYKKLSNAKASIDNTPPKSIAKSQKVRDRMQSSRPNSRLSDRPTSRNTARPYSQLADSDIYDETYWGNPEDEEETNVMSIMKDVLKRPSNESAAHRKGNPLLSKTMGWPQNGAAPTYRQTAQMPRPASARSMGSTLTRTGPQAPGSRTSGDVLEKRSHVFTEPDRPFTPRTLKSTRGSRLAEYKYYTPPKKGSVIKRDRSDKDVVDGPDESRESATQLSASPVAKPRKRQPSSNSKLDVTQDSENTLMFETLQTRDMSRSKPDKTKMVPPLDISVDKDHMHWLQEQATKAQIRVSARSQKGSGNDGAGRSPRDLRRSGEQDRSFGSTRSWAQDRLLSEEEELKYVEFVKAVTQDVLDRGIFTNRVLLHAFENHIEKNKHHLNERKMRSLLAQLREDLGIPSEREANLDADNVGHSSRRSSGYRMGELSRERTLTPQKTLPYTPAGLDRTGTTTWQSEDGGTLRTTKFGETLGSNSMGLTQGMKTTDSYNDDLPYSATLENDNDILTVTQALETYQFNISKQDSRENHLARDNYSNNNSVVSGGCRAPDIPDSGVAASEASTAASDIARSAVSDRDTPRGKRRMRKMQSAQQQSDGLLDSVSQVGEEEEDRQSVLSGSRQSVESGRVVSPRSQFSASLYQRNAIRNQSQTHTAGEFRQHTRATERGDVNGYTDRGRETLARDTPPPAMAKPESEEEYVVNERHSAAGESGGHFTDHGSNAGHFTDHGSNAGCFADHGSNADHFTDNGSNAGRFTDHGSNADRFTDNESNAGHFTDHGSNADQFPEVGSSADHDIDRGSNANSHTSHASGRQHDHQSLANHSDRDEAGNANRNLHRRSNADDHLMKDAEDGGNAEDYDDDYGDDVGDADDEEATTLTHRTSDDDF